MHCWAENSCSIGPSADGNKWKWNTSPDDWNIYAHAFDQNGPSGGNEIPYKYSTTVSDWSKSGNEYWSHPNIIPRCTTTTATGETLYSGTRIPSTSKACVANTHNAGNWYNYPAATAGSNNASTATEKDMPNSICPKGWRLPPNSGNKSFNTLIRTAYGLTATNSDSTLLAGSAYSAMSFVRLGDYGYVYGSLDNRGGIGHYWSSTASSSVSRHDLAFYSGLLSPQYGDNSAVGFSIRCVSR